MPGPGYAFLGDEETKNVNKVLEQWGLTRYSYNVPEFTSFVRKAELQAQEYLGTEYAIAVNSGTSALTTSLAAFGVGPGDEVLVPGYTFVATIGSVVASGATPILVEVDDTLTISPEDIRRKLTRRTRAIIPVHMLGTLCDMDAILSIAKENNLFILEDVAQAYGASYNGKRAGTLGNMGAFSFNPFKVITSGEGGLVVTDDGHLYQRAYSYQDQGWFPLRTDHGDGDLIFGVNLRMSELTGAVAAAQIAKADYVLDSVRTTRRKFVEHLSIDDCHGVKLKPQNDADGECGTVLVLQFDTNEKANWVASQLGSQTLYYSGRHNYKNMRQIDFLYSKQSPSSVFHRYQNNNEDENHQKATLQATDYILSRSLGVSIGVSDDYLGAGYGVTVTSSDEEIESSAKKLRMFLSE